MQDLLGGQVDFMFDPGIGLNHVRAGKLKLLALRDAPFGMGHVALCCALSYLDYCFETLGWRTLAPRLADWYAAMRERPTIKGTEPLDG